jgi:hypothetical protein
VPTKKDPGKSLERRISPPPATKEEERQLQELVAEPPWSLTLRAFLAKVEASYGLRLCRVSADHPQGGKMEIWYLQSADKETTVHLPGIGMDEQLDPFTTGSLCRRMGVPPEDFGLAAEEPDGGEEFDPED